LISSFFFERKSKIKNFFLILFSFSIYFFFIFFLNPFFWKDFISNFFYLIKIFSSFPHKVYVLYLGDFIRSDRLPWHYVFVWIFISQPILYSIFSTVGFILIFKRIFQKFLKLEKRKINNFNLWNNQKEKFDLFIILLFLLNLFLILKLNATLYDGWRHLYFLHFFIIYFILYSINVFYLFFKKLRLFFNYISIIYCLILFYINYNFHPFQNNYFNFLIRNPHKYFYIDHWGISNKDALKKILEIEKKREILISNASFTSLEKSSEILLPDEKKRIKFVGQNYKISDYIITNGYSEVNKTYNNKYLIPENFKLIYEKVIYNVNIYQIYKKENI